MTDNITDAEIVPEVAPEAPQEAPPQEAPKQLSWDKKAYMHFEAYMGEFARRVNSYSGSRRQLQRAWINAAISPLNKEELHFSYPEEEEIFNLFNELNSAKLLLMMHGFAQDGKIEIKEAFFEHFNKPVTVGTPQESEKTNG